MSLLNSFTSEELKLAAKYNICALAARILLMRLGNNHLINSLLTATTLSNLESPYLLNNMAASAQRLAEGLVAEEKIAVVTDYDCDGLSSAATIISFLRNIVRYPEEKFCWLTAKRLYGQRGFTNELCQQIVAFKATLVLTADMGSSREDAVSVTNLAKQNIVVIVTDHHCLGSNPTTPFFINPMVADNKKFNPDICGCAVVWLLLVCTFQLLKKTRKLYGNPLSLIDFVSLGTLSDQCCLMSSNNRIFINVGLKLLRSFKRPCFQLLRQLQVDLDTERDILFNVIPLINCCSRCGEVQVGLDFLLAADLDSAARLYAKLNYFRSRIKQQVDTIISAYPNNTNEAVRALFIEDCSIGVNSLVAIKMISSSVVAIVFSAAKATDKDTDDFIYGSYRSATNINFLQHLIKIDEQTAKLLLIKYGGHANAGGVVIKRSSLGKFRKLCQQSIVDHPRATPHRKVQLDTIGIPESFLINNLYNSIDSLRPFGKNFNMPLFKTSAVVLKVTPTKRGHHYLLSLNIGKETVSAILFNPSKDDAWLGNLKSHSKVNIVHEVVKNRFGLKLVIQNISRHS